MHKKLPRFVPTLTEVVQGSHQPATLSAERGAEEAVPIEALPEDGIYTQVLAAAEQYLAKRMPELVAQHMAACELELRQELQTIIKRLVAEDV